MGHLFLRVAPESREKINFSKFFLKLFDQGYNFWKFQPKLYYFLLEKDFPHIFSLQVAPIPHWFFAFFEVLTFQGPTLEHFSPVHVLLQCLQLLFSWGTKLAKPRKGLAWIQAGTSTYQQKMGKDRERNNLGVP